MTNLLWPFTKILNSLRSDKRIFAHNTNLSLLSTTKVPVEDKRIRQLQPGSVFELPRAQDDRSYVLDARDDRSYVLGGPALTKYPTSPYTETILFVDRRSDTNEDQK